MTLGPRLDNHITVQNGQGWRGAQHPRHFSEKPLQEGRADQRHPERDDVSAFRVMLRCHARNAALLVTSCSYALSMVVSLDIRRASALSKTSAAQGAILRCCGMVRWHVGIQKDGRNLRA